MQTFGLIVLLIVAVLISAVVDQLVSKVSIPLIQIGLGFIIALLAFSPIDVTVEPEFFLVLFIAPLLFHDAKHADKQGLWKNRGPILSLAIGLVLVIVLAVGFSVHFLIPSVPLAAAFALGAALGPTDAVAVSSLQSSAELGKRESALLSGEALINDASGVVSFQFAIAAAVTGAFSLLDASVSFLISFFGGIILGILLALAAHFIQNKVRDLGLESITFHVLFDISLPFLFFLIAEAVHVSGILAVVAAGLVISSFSERSIGPSVSRLNIVSSNVWRVLVFVLNGVVFVMLGMQLPRALQATWDDVAINNFVLIGLVLLITVILVLVRFLWLFVMGSMSKESRSRNKEQTRFSKASAKSALIATVGGPKGAITLSIVLSIPIMASSGSAFPQRELLIFLASGVILCTLLLANFALPVLAPVIKQSDEEAEEESALASISILRSVIEHLNGARNNENASAVDAVIASYNQRIGDIRDKADLRSTALPALTLQVMEAQEEHLIELIEKGEVDEVEAYRYIRRLDKAEALVKQRDAHHPVRKLGQGAKRNFHMLWRFIVAFLHVVPGMTEIQRSEDRRKVQAASERFAIDYLNSLAEQPDNTFPVNEIARLVQVHRSALANVLNKRPDITSYTRTTDEMDAIERRAYAWELEEIQDRYDAGTLSRAQTRRMRDNVYLMQVDLENHV